MSYQRALDEDGADRYMWFTAGRNPAIVDAAQCVFSSDDKFPFGFILDSDEDSGHTICIPDGRCHTVREVATFTLIEGAETSDTIGSVTVSELRSQVEELTEPLLSLADGAFVVSEYHDSGYVTVWAVRHVGPDPIAKVR